MESESLVRVNRRISWDKIFLPNIRKKTNSVVRQRLGVDSEPVSEILCPLSSAITFLPKISAVSTVKLSGENCRYSARLSFCRAKKLCILHVRIQRMDRTNKVSETPYA